MRGSSWRLMEFWQQVEWSRCVQFPSSRCCKAVVFPAPAHDSKKKNCSPLPTVTHLGWLGQASLHAIDEALVEPPIPTFTTGW